MLVLNSKRSCLQGTDRNGERKDEIEEAHGGESVVSDEETKLDLQSCQSHVSKRNIELEVLNALSTTSNVPRAKRMPPQPLRRLCPTWLIPREVPSELIKVGRLQTLKTGSSQRREYQKLQ
jgi:hypothetical protein